MPLIPIERVRFATDGSMATITRTPGTEFREALTELLEQIAAGIIANDPTLIAAAEAAVADALAGWGFTNERDSAFTVTDTAGRTALKVDETGLVRTYVAESDRHFFGSTELAPGESQTQFVIKDANERVALKVRRDGAVEIPALVGAGGGGGGDAFGVSRVILACMLGQSNGEGRGRPVSVRLDPTDPRILMWNFSLNALATATVPTSSQREQVGLSPITPIARELVGESVSTRVVIVNTAVGGSGLVNDVSAGVWKVDYAGANPRLFPAAMTAILAARDAARTRYGVEPEVRFYWHQGESDGPTPRETYRDALIELIGAARTQVGDVTAPFTIGGMVPERVAGTSAEQTRLAQMEVAATALYAAYTDGIPGGGGSENPSDTTHYTRQGVLALGKAMYGASQRALTATADQVPHTPLNVRAAYAGGRLEVSWDEPDTRYTQFIVQHRSDGGAWQSVTLNPPDVKATITGVSGSVVEVRVQSINEQVASLYSTPVLAH